MGYWDRFRFFYYLTDPKTLLASSADVEAAKQLVQAVHDGRSALDSAFAKSEFQRSQRLLDATLHPETQRPIFLPFRFSAFLPMNMMTLLGMLHPAMQTPVRSMFWQWVNQTYNVGVNYCNGSASGEMSNAKLFAAYSVAVVASCGTAFGLNAWRQKLGSRCPKALSVMIPFVSVALANIANVAVIRSPDLVDGVCVYDTASGEEMPKSIVAGRTAVTQVAISRVMVPIPLMLLPPIFMDWLTAPGRFLSTRAALHTPVQISMILVLLRFALPLCIAVFPQECVMDAKYLEPSMREWKNSKGELVTSVRFNKGL